MSSGIGNQLSLDSGTDYLRATRIPPVKKAMTHHRYAYLEYKCKLLGTSEFNPVFDFCLQIRMASINIPSSEEYPIIPWVVNPPFDEPRTIKVVAIISRQTPRVRKINTVLLITFLRCSVIMATE